jgi:hypothetical protein
MTTFPSRCSPAIVGVALACLTDRGHAGVDQTLELAHPV